MHSCSTFTPTRRLLWVEGGELAAKQTVLLGMHLGHHLHQALGAHRALGEGVEARLDRHHCKDQGRVQLVLGTQVVRLGHQGADRLGGDPVFLAQPVGKGGLLFGKLPRVGRGGPLDPGEVSHDANGICLAGLQPGDQLDFAQVAQLGLEGKSSGYKDDHHTEEGEAVVGDFEDALGNVGGEGPKPVADFLERGHAVSFSSCASPSMPVAV